jgi:hypothetical protein
MLRFVKFVSLAVAVFAAVVSVDISPEATTMLLERGNGGNDVWIANVFYTCQQGNIFAMVRNGTPADVETYDVVDTGQVRVHVSKEMAFTDDLPKIVVFPRKTGNRDVGSPNVIQE